LAVLGTDVRCAKLGEVAESKRVISAICRALRACFKVQMHS
jgi:hypothetical protein